MKEEALNVGDIVEFLGSSIVGIIVGVTEDSYTVFSWEKVGGYYAKEKDSVKKIPFGEGKYNLYWKRCSQLDI